MQRKDDKRQEAHFRTNRMFQENGAWYFKTRDDGAIGPFEDELTASTQLEVYIRNMESGLSTGQMDGNSVKNSA
jgi:hypothetical protein